MSSLTDYMQSMLDQALASRSGNQAKLDFLAIEQGNWALRFRHFARTGEQPFGGPHPQFGPMQATDFVVVIGMIESARGAIKRRMEAVHA